MRDMTHFLLENALLFVCLDFVSIRKYMPVLLMAGVAKEAIILYFFHSLQIQLSAAHFCARFEFH